MLASKMKLPRRKHIASRQGLLDPWQQAPGLHRLIPDVSADADDPSTAATSAGTAFRAHGRLQVGWGAVAGKGSHHAASRSKSVARRASSSMHLMRRTRGDVYCVLRCEGGVRRTALAASRPAPVWREDVAFKAVSIGSDLQVLIHRSALWAIKCHIGFE